MSKNIAKKTENGLLPINSGNETRQLIDQFLACDDVEVHKKNNKLTLRRVTPTESVTVEVRNYPDTTSVTQSKTLRNRPVSQMGDTIKKMRSEGQTQAEVADKLGTTQSNIAKIEKRTKN